MGKQSNRSKRTVSAIIVSCICASALGCAPSPRTVEGEVTLDGNPLNEAAVMFVPLDHGRSKTAALIVDGKYTLPVKDGLLPGTYRVEIVDAPPLGASEHSASGAPQDKPKTKRRKLPPDYSHRSPFRLDVPATNSSAVLTASYELKSNPADRNH
jgi:hypothetical protein